MNQEVVMTRRLCGTALLLLAPVLTAAGTAGGNQGLIAHEWGTFTSIAGEDGRAVEWRPQAGPAELPAFVEQGTCPIKGALPGVVRMETPVIYFYAPRETTVNVRVQFREGAITEWFPRPVGNGERVIDAALSGRFSWPNVRVRPGTSASFPVE